MSVLLSGHRPARRLARLSVMSLRIFVQGSLAWSYYLDSRGKA